MKRIATVILIALVTMLSGCIVENTLYEDKISQPTGTIEQHKYVSLEALYRKAPIHSTDQKDWEQWENEYGGKYVKGKGRFESVSIHPQESKLFFIVRIFDGGGAGESDTAQVALLVEDAQTIKLGEKEGSFLLNDIKWFFLGDGYAFEGMVSKFSGFDTELVASGYGDLIIIQGKLQDISKVVIVENSAGASNGDRMDGLITPTADNAKAKKFTINTHCGLWAATIRKICFTPMGSLANFL